MVGGISNMWQSNAMLKTSLSVYVVFMVAAKRVTNANRLSCVCSLAECENVSESDCPNGAGTVWDSCRCCRVCARIENEPCGGPFGFSGSCAIGLECVNVDFLDKNAVGVCTRIINKDITCEKPKYLSGCNIVNRSCRCERSKSCADDSSPFSFKTRQECQLNLNAMLTRTDEDDDKIDKIEDSVANDEEDLDKQCPPDSILTSEDECKCSLENCPPSQFSCKRGFTLTIAQKGSGKPGDCCDKFICAPDSGKNCTNVICPEIPSCPPDSSRLPAIKSLDDCCAVPQGCQCLPQCEPSKCAPDSVPVIVSEGNGMPGKCCAVYQCEKRDDEESSPNYEEPIPNSQDCLIENVYKKNGMNWTSSDHCTLCTCKDGLPICESFACVPCLRPIPEPGQCCPRCGDTSVQPAHCPPLPDCSQRCPNGHVEDENGCLTCQCRKDCPKDCTIDIGENGEQICRCGPKCFPLENCQKKCLFGFQKDEDDCDICECEKCTKQCSRGYLIDKGLSVCKCQPWLPFGNNATEIGLSVPCSTEENIWRDDGETWFDGCRHCSCIAGREMCSLIHCSPFTCSRPIVNSTLNCCPFCPDDPTTNAEMNHMVCTSPSGGIMLEGENLKLDECTTCVCHNGMALCRGKDCPPTLCSKPKPPAPGECCSTCPPLDATELDPTTIHGGNDAECDSATANDTAWRESSCVSCRCIGTKKNCFTELCDSTNNCKRSLMIKGKCCPICIDKTDKYKLEGMCLHENSSYNNGEEWTVDLCTRCKCMAGQTRCTQKGCPQPCSNVVRQSDHCCSCGADSGPDSRSMPEILYIVVLLLVVCASVALVVCLTRHWRSKKQQIRLRDLGCLPPQYQYKYIRTSPYDAKSSQKIILSEKTSLAPV